MYSCPSLQVLYLTEPIDEVTIQNMAKFGEHAFVDVSKEEIDLGEDEDEKAKVRAALRWSPGIAETPDEVSPARTGFGRVPCASAV